MLMTYELAKTIQQLQYSIYKTKMGMRPFPEGTVFDLLCHTYEGSRAVWRKIPVLVAINIFVAFAAVGAMIWSGERFFTNF